MPRHQSQTVPVPPARRVVVALRMTGFAGVEKLKGIFEFLATGHRWDLHLLRTRQECTAEYFRAELAKGIDGVIISIPDVDDALRELAHTDLPIVLMDLGDTSLVSRSRKVLSVCDDTLAIGKEAAAVFLSQGTCKNYGFVGHPANESWSAKRGRAFCDAIAKAGFTVHIFNPQHINGHAALQEWLLSLSLPCGIFTACDDLAFEVVNTCHEVGLRIPSEIAVLGVDNNPLFCENTDPKLSSIQLDFRHEGFLAAEKLERLMSGQTEETRTTLIGFNTVVHRESTFPISQAGRLVQKALAFINHNALRKIGVPDVAAHLKVSTSLLKLRFRELQHESVYSAIARIRLDEVKRRLDNSCDSIEKISADCGWSNLNTLKNFFKRHEGISMRTWRERQK